MDGEVMNCGSFPVEGITQCTDAECNEANSEEGGEEGGGRRDA